MKHPSDPETRADQPQIESLQDEELANNNVYNVETAVREDVAGATDTTAETAEEADKPQAPAILKLKPRIEKLREIGGERYYDYDKLFETYKKQRRKVPKEEDQRIKNLAAQILLGENFDKFVDVSTNIWRSSERDLSPIITLPRPEFTIFQGSEMPSSIASEERIMRVGSGKSLVISDCVPGEISSKELGPDGIDIYNKVWPSELTCYSAAPLKGSKDRHYFNNEDGKLSQLNHQIQVILSAVGADEGKIQKIINSPLDSQLRKDFRAEYGIEADMILAMALRYISGKEKLLRQGFMQLNTRGTDGEPLSVYFYGAGLYLDYSFSSAHSGGGVGASFRISS